MKLKTKIIIISILAILFISCSINQLEKGSIPIRLPESGADRATGDYSYARILLLTEAGYVNIDTSTEEVFKDVPYSEGAYTIENIKPSTYDIIVLFGDKTSTGVFTDYSAYAIADDYTITAGINNSISLTIVSSDFVWTPAFVGKNSTQVLNINEDIYIKSEGANEGVYKNSTELSFNDATIGTIQSIGNGTDAAGLGTLWLNTNRGIYPYNGESLDKDFSSALVSETLVIRESAGMRLDGGDSEDIFIAFYQGEGSVGAVLIDEDEAEADWEWFNKESLVGDPDDPDDNGNPEVAELLEDLDTLVYDFEVNGSYAYVATALPLDAFRISADTMEILDEVDAFGVKTFPKEPTFDDAKKLVDFITVKDSNGDLETIKALVSEGSNLYLGSEKGLYITTVNSTTDGSLTNEEAVTTLVAGTTGRNFKKLVSTTGYVAALTDGGVMIISGSSVVKEYMFYQGLPGELTDLSWQGTKLFITGSAGVVELEM